MITGERCQVREVLIKAFSDKPGVGKTTLLLRIKQLLDDAGYETQWEHEHVIAVRWLDERPPTAEEREEAAVVIHELMHKGEGVKGDA